MSFGCPICQERLDKLPAHLQSKNVKCEDIDVASTPCGHIFHSFCIQKWLTGDIASSKQCPCCRKPVPGLKVLPLFPNGFTNLDDTVNESAFGDDNRAPCDHSHFNSQISTLKKMLENAQDKVKEAEEFLQIERDVSAEFKKKLANEKLRSDNYMFNWKKAESYKSYAEQQEREAKELAARLQQYTMIDAMLRNVQTDVEYDLPTYSPTMDSMKKLLETYHIMKGEYEMVSKKLNNVQAKQEADRLEISKWRKKHDDLQSAYAELQRAHKKSNNYNPDATIQIETPSPVYRAQASGFQEAMRHDRTPLLKSTFPKKKISARNEPNVDADVLIMPAFGIGKKKLISKRKENPTTSTSSSSSEIDLSSQKSSKSSEQEPPRKLTKTAKTSSSATEDKPKTSKVKKVSPVVDEFYSPSRKPSAKKTCISPLLFDVSSSDSDDDFLALAGTIPGMKVTPRTRLPKEPEAPKRKFTFKKKS